LCKDLFTKFTRIVVWDNVTLIATLLGIAGN
jgi:hypothetical protein